MTPFDLIRMQGLVSGKSNQLTQHTTQVYRLALRLSKDRHQAEDLTQETMLRAFRKLNTLTLDDRLLVWLLRITVNLWRDQLRTKKRKPVEGLKNDPVDKQPTVEQKLFNTERLEAALAAMDSLPERQRVVLHLYAVEQLSLAEIADVVGINTNTAKVNLFHARKTMNRKLPQIIEGREQMASLPVEVRVAKDGGDHELP